MPEKKPLTVAAYAAGASLAAATLIYVFAPTYFLDNEPSGGSSTGGFLTGGGRSKKGVVGLANPGNDCFINSSLQALAGLGELRIYLIREMHRRGIDEEWVYTQPVPEDFREEGVTKNTTFKRHLVEGQQRGLVTQGLKDMLDQLNERPIYRKTISAGSFVVVLQNAFKQNISRQQHDAQEFLQVVVERLCDEYHAGRRARNYAKWKASRADSEGSAEPVGVNGDAVTERLAAVGLEDQERNSTEPDGAAPTSQPRPAAAIPSDDDEDGFPMEGVTESQIECLSCGFKPKPTEHKFCMLTLSVAMNTSSTTLNQCFDGMFKTEYIDDYKCEKCRLVHAHEVLKGELARATSPESKKRKEEALGKLRRAIETDPEAPPEDVDLPDSKHAPKRRIARHTRITLFPKLLAIHLNRSMFTGQALKNQTKVAFPERLPLGGVLLRRNYKLLGVIAHKGAHETGHYETFRRQNVYPPYSNPSTFQPAGVYSKAATPLSTPQGVTSPASTPTPESSHRSSPPLTATTNGKKEKDTDTSSLRSIAASARSTISKISPSRHGSISSRSGRTTNNTTPDAQPNGNAAAPPPPPTTTKPPKKKRHRKTPADRWWRISDEKIKEASTRELLGMQREVFLLFFEMERPDGP